MTALFRVRCFSLFALDEERLRDVIAELRARGSTHVTASGVVRLALRMMARALLEDAEDAEEVPQDTDPPRAPRVPRSLPARSVIVRHRPVRAPRPAAPEKPRRIVPPGRERAVFTCSRCHQSGHTSKARRCPLSTENQR